MIIYYILAILLLALDQWSKLAIVNNFALHEVKEVLPGILSLFYIRNEGAAWGIFEGRMFFFFVITVVVVGAMVYNAHKQGFDKKIVGISYAFLLSGALGNFIDRMRLGYVVDMFRLDFIDFPIFNVADVCLTIGVILMAVYILFFEEEEQTASKSKLKK
ncbi:signal peptidase II [Trichococcus ilyis]|uniref:Lipoprotein signal peptidase n=1 Tax=Trichococcus ilyis TaxID=640938 RepID=A0A143Y691_9LACT|nr:signal peptidase II [Trichococcus ilyis]CZQ80953.1 peptidase a8 signal peptidase ii [Trichococcus ilyis]SEI54446.1 signal peptidase II [Trichococcus ilyis]